MTPSQLADRLRQVAESYPLDGAYPLHLLPAVEALPDGDYKVLDPESDSDQIEEAGLGDPWDLAASLDLSVARRVADWPAAEEMGYGQLSVVNTPQGEGLEFVFGGSPGNSAFSIWVLPAACLPEQFPSVEELASFDV